MNQTQQAPSRTTDVTFHVALDNGQVVDAKVTIGHNSDEQLYNALPQIMGQFCVQGVAEYEEGLVGNARKVKKYYGGKRIDSITHTVHTITLEAKPLPSRITL